MQNHEDTIIEIRKYINKLKRYVLKDGVVISLFGKSIIKKKRLDDILVCIEASFPEEYKKYVKDLAADKLTSHIAYMALRKELLQTALYSGENYIINEDNVMSGIETVLRTIPKDIKYVMEYYNH